MGGAELVQSASEWGLWLTGIFIAWLLWNAALCVLTYGARSCGWLRPSVAHALSPVIWLRATTPRCERYAELQRVLTPSLPLSRLLAASALLSQVR